MEAARRGGWGTARRGSPATATAPRPDPATRAPPRRGRTRAASNPGARGGPRPSPATTLTDGLARVERARPDTLPAHVARARGNRRPHPLARVALGGARSSAVDDPAGADQPCGSL